MLAREFRLRQARDITRVYKTGVYGAASGVLSVKAAPSGRASSRAVVVIGKKVNKRAVVRNTLRRRLIEALRSNWATLRSGYDIVITVHSDVSELSSSRLIGHLQHALTRAGVITK